MQRTLVVRVLYQPRFCGRRTLAPCQRIGGFIRGDLAPRDTILPQQRDRLGSVTRSAFSASFWLVRWASTPYDLEWTLGSFSVPACSQRLPPPELRRKKAGRKPFPRVNSRRNWCRQSACRTVGRRRLGEPHEQRPASPLLERDVGRQRRARAIRRCSRIGAHHDFCPTARACLAFNVVQPACAGLACSCSEGAHTRSSELAPSSGARPGACQPNFRQPKPRRPERKPRQHGTAQHRSHTAGAASPCLGTPAE